MNLAALSDLARRYGKAKSTVHKWTERDDFPAPLGTVATKVRVWNTDEIDHWLLGRGRLPLLTARSADKKGGEP